MTTSKLRIILEGYVRYRDGKKWKKRYCVLSQAPTTQDAVHLYITKSYDDFASYRNSGVVLAALLPAVRDPSDLPLNEESRAKAGDLSVPSGCRSSTGPLVNTALQSCAAALEATNVGLAAASTLASFVGGGPFPLDEISGFESGCHMDKESNIIVLIGCSSVFAIALPRMDEMFRWAEALKRIVVDNRFRVTLRQSGDRSKLSQGLQGILHVQHWRLCLISEPSSGCKFICSWRLDHIEKAHTMIVPNSYTMATTPTTSSDNPFLSRSFHHHHHHHYSTVANQHKLSNCSTASSSSTAAAASVSTSSSPAKHLFSMECSQAAGKGRGSYLFELDAFRLNELTMAIDQMMDLRFNPKQKPATLAEMEHFVSVTSGLVCSRPSFLTQHPTEDSLHHHQQQQQQQQPMPHLTTTSDDLGVVSSSFSSDASSISPGRNSGATSGIGSGSGVGVGLHPSTLGNKFRRDSGLCNLLKHMSTSSSHSIAKLMPTEGSDASSMSNHHHHQQQQQQQQQSKNHQRTLFGQSVPVLSNTIASFRSGQKSTNYFNLPPSTSPPSSLSYSPPVSAGGGGGGGPGSDHVYGNSLSRLISKYGPMWSLNNKFKQFQSTGGTTNKHCDSVISSIDNSQPSSNEISSHSSRHHICMSPNSQHVKTAAPTDMTACFDSSNLADADLNPMQVAKVAAGLIIAKKPPTNSGTAWSYGRSLMRTTSILAPPPPPLPPPPSPSSQPYLIPYYRLHSMTGSSLSIEDKCSKGQEQHHNKPMGNDVKASRLIDEMDYDDDDDDDELAFNSQSNAAAAAQHDVFSADEDMWTTSVDQLGLNPNSTRSFGRLSSRHVQHPHVHPDEFAAIYRHRLQQYRSCICPNLSLTRSKSVNDSLDVIDLLYSADMCSTDSLNGVQSNTIMTNLVGGPMPTVIAGGHLFSMPGTLDRLEKTDRYCERKFSQSHDIIALSDVGSYRQARVKPTTTMASFTSAEHIGLADDSFKTKPADCPIQNWDFISALLSQYRYLFVCPRHGVFYPLTNLLYAASDSGNKSDENTAANSDLKQTSSSRPVGLILSNDTKNVGKSKAKSSLFRSHLGIRMDDDSIDSAAAAAAMISMVKRKCANLHQLGHKCRNTNRLSSNFDMLPTLMTTPTDAPIPSSPTPPSSVFGSSNFKHQSPLDLNVEDACSQSSWSFASEPALSQTERFKYLAFESFTDDYSVNWMTENLSNVSLCHSGGGDNENGAAARRCDHHHQSMEMLHPEVVSQSFILDSNGEDVVSGSMKDKSHSTCRLDFETPKRTSRLFKMAPDHGKMLLALMAMRMMMMATVNRKANGGRINVEQLKMGYNKQMDATPGKVLGAGADDVNSHKVTFNQTLPARVQSSVLSSSTSAKIKPKPLSTYSKLSSQSEKNYCCLITCDQEDHSDLNDLEYHHHRHLKQNYSANQYCNVRPLCSHNSSTNSLHGLDSIARSKDCSASFERHLVEEEEHDESKVDLFPRVDQHNGLVSPNSFNNNSSNNNNNYVNIPSVMLQSVTLNSGLLASSLSSSSLEHAAKPTPCRRTYANLVPVVAGHNNKEAAEGILSSSSSSSTGPPHVGNFDSIVDHVATWSRSNPTSYKYSDHLASNLNMESMIPDEVRDPMRNYAIVDLRPSPASSIQPANELMLHPSSTHHRQQSNLVDSSTTSSTIGDVILNSCCTSSSLGLTSTGSDATSNTATLTSSDTLEGYWTIGAGTSANIAQSKSKDPSQFEQYLTDGAACLDQQESSANAELNRFFAMTSNAPSQYQHNSSSWSSIHAEPNLNYVHVISGNSLLNGGGLGHKPSALPDDTQTDFNDLTTVTCQSTTPPTGRASSSLFGAADVASCRSMNSSVTSSSGGATNCSPSDQSSVAYIQMDFTRTIALGELSGNMASSCESSAVDYSFTNGLSHASASLGGFANSSFGKQSATPHLSKAKFWPCPKSSHHGLLPVAGSSSADRSASIKKTISQSIRYIGGRGLRKKHASTTHSPSVNSIQFPHR